MLLAPQTAEVVYDGDPVAATKVHPGSRRLLSLLRFTAIGSYEARLLLLA